jgi:hypothetical protein
MKLIKNPDIFIYTYVTMTPYLPNKSRFVNSFIVLRVFFE